MQTASKDTSNELSRDVLLVDDCSLPEARATAATFGNASFGYIVTANADHAIRHYEDKNFRALYASASYVLLDSRFLVRLLRLLKGSVLRAAPGSDLTHALFEEVIQAHDRIILVGGTAEQAQTLRELYGLEALHHVDPPMNLMRNPSAIEACVKEVEALSPFRFCFVTVGSPQQEVIACKLRERGIARGLALCVGSSVNFITGVEQRAPTWMQEGGFEWAYRLLQQPRRMAYRYLVRGPKIFWVACRIDLRLRRPLISPQAQTQQENTEEASEMAPRERLLRAAGAQ
jgi:exopolysaccharide biosynthesis WecB/TagA/CpsF family protein